jgi:hypothetical protein
MSRVAKQVYRGAVEFGRIESYASLFMGNMIGIIFLIAGILILKSKPQPQIVDKNKEQPQQNNKTGGWIFIGLGIFVIVSAWIYWWVIRKSDVAAAANAAEIVSNWF